MGVVDGQAGAGADELDDDEVRLVLDAATPIFRDHGPRSVTLKWVALAADVGVAGLTARWPDVDSLYGAVLDDLATTIDRLARDDHCATPAETDARDALVGVYQRIIARGLLDDVNPAERQQAFPLVERLLDLFRATGRLDERSARYRVAQAYALEFGWRLFGPHLMTACGLEDEVDEGRATAEVRALQEHLLDVPPPSVGDNTGGA